MVIIENLETWKRTGTIIKINLNPTVVGNHWFHFQNPFLLLKNLWSYFWIHVFLRKQMSLQAPEGCPITVRDHSDIISRVNCVNAFSIKDVISLPYVFCYYHPICFCFPYFLYDILTKNDSWSFSCMQGHSFVQNFFIAFRFNSSFLLRSESFCSPKFIRWNPDLQIWSY